MCENHVIFFFLGSLGSAKLVFFCCLWMNMKGIGSGTYQEWEIREKSKFVLIG